MMNGEHNSRPPTPESPLTNSLYHANGTVDELTSVLASFSRVPSPEPAQALSCCCGKEDCENLKCWVEIKDKLNERLVLSAEVGQALLKRHEAYVRQSERRLRLNRTYSENEEPAITNEDLQQEFDDLLKEKEQLEKRLNQALVNNEVTEVSSKTILQELQEARDTISRLTAHHARSIGWDTRLSAALKERDDMQQERDGETHRARLAESRFAALKEKTAKLQSEVRRLQDSLEVKRQHRLESSEHLIEDARSRLESFRGSHLGVTAKLAEDELTGVVEQLVHDNETLKHDNDELQHLLAESREEIHTLQEELEEQRANPVTTIPSRSGANTPHSRHFHTGSVPSVNLKDLTMFSPKGRRNASVEGRSRRRSSGTHSVNLRISPAPPEPPIPDALRSPMTALSATESLAPSWAAFGQASPLSSHVSFEVDDEADNSGSPTLYEKPRGHRPLLLLTRSRGVQTDNLPSGALSPSPLPSHMSSSSPQDPRSESSSFSESQASQISAILERVVTLLNRLTQADALTLTNRLKRQHLKGADVGHLSRSTIGNILVEANGLRAQFRPFLEDEKVITTCTRKDLRLLFKIIKDMFTELGQMRVTLNDVILDPSSAPKVSELALNPGKAEAEKKEREAGGGQGASGWMAPLSKLLSPMGLSESVSSAPTGLTRSNSGRGSARPARFVPKLGPALAASATTVNVEFSGTGVGRAVTNTVQPQVIPTPEPMLSPEGSSGTQSTSSGLMGIFAGAPKLIEPADPWVVLSGAPSRSPQQRRNPQLIRQLNVSADSSYATLGRSAQRKNINRLSRNVDAVIDVDRPLDVDDDSDFFPPLLERTLKRRGLSDSSIHSTFTVHGEDDGQLQAPPSPHRPTRPSPIAAPSARMAAWPSIQALSRSVFNFRNISGSVVPTSGLSREVMGSPSGSRSREGSREGSRSRKGSRIDTNVAAGPGDTSVDLPSTPVDPSASASSTTITPSAAMPTPRKSVLSPQQPQTPLRVASPNRGAEGGRGVVAGLTNWAAQNIIIDPVSGSDPFIASSLRDETYMHRVARNPRLGRQDDGHVRDFY